VAGAGVVSSGGLDLELGAEMCRQGVAALVFDHAGFGRSDALPGVKRQTINTWRQMRCVRSALTFLEGDGRVDSTRLGLCGYSLGGHVCSVVSGVDLRVKAAALLVPELGTRVFPPGKLDTEAVGKQIHANVCGELAGVQQRIDGEEKGLLGPKPLVSLDGNCIIKGMEAVHHATHTWGKAARKDWVNKAAMAVTDGVFAAPQVVAPRIAGPVLGIVAPGDECVNYDVSTKVLATCPVSVTVQVPSAHFGWQYGGSTLNGMVNAAVGDFLRRALLTGSADGFSAPDCSGEWDRGERAAATSVSHMYRAKL